MVGASCRVRGEVEPGAPAWGDGESCPGGGRSVLQGLRGWTTGRTGLGGRGVLPRGWSERPAGPAGIDNRAHRPGGTGSPAQGVVGVSCRACGDGQPGAPAWGDGESCPGGGRSVLQVLLGGRTGHTGLGGWGVLPRGWSECLAGPAGIDNRAHRPRGMGSPAQGVVGASCRACGEVEPGAPAWGDGKSCPGGGRSVLHGSRGDRTGRTGLGGWGVLPRGWSERPAGPAGIDNRAHRPGGMGSPAQGVVRVSWRRGGGRGGLYLTSKDVGYPYRGVQPDGCSGGQSDSCVRLSRYTISKLNPLSHLPIHIPPGQELARAAGPRTASPAGPRRPAGSAFAAAPRRQAVWGLFCGAGGRG